MDRPTEPRKRQELREKRRDLHGKRRKLHERLSEVCEDFVLEDLTRDHRRQALVHELQYLLDYYKDEAAWQGVE